jgi:hypothetical protein
MACRQLVCESCGQFPCAAAEVNDAQTFASLHQPDKIIEGLKALCPELLVAIRIPGHESLT